MNVTAIRPWPALWALVIGLFMILMDTTIITVANPRIMQALHTDMTAVLWATSGYLLSYAVPLLVTGRLGDRFGPKRIYLLGLVVVTLSSAWAGLVGSVERLIVARIAQGLGAALLTPQTMAVVTGIFPPASRGRAMNLWGAAAAVATLAGPILGGFIVDAMGWEWIFFVNVPIGIIVFVLGFAAAMSMSMLLPAGAALLGATFTLAFTERHERQAWRPPSAAEPPLAEPVH